VLNDDFRVLPPLDIHSRDTRLSLQVGFKSQLADWPFTFSAGRRGWISVSLILTGVRPQDLPGRCSSVLDATQPTFLV